VAVTAEAQPEKLALIARDGYRLGATLYRAAADVDRVVLVMAATGVPQEYYGQFATYLAERNCGVLTFDYRGIGRSLHSALRDETPQWKTGRCSTALPRSISLSTSFRPTEK
jgi:predicted alpha/beta hydrolase